MNKPKEPRPPSDRGQGRKPLQEGVETVTVGVRMLPEDRDRLRLLRGNAWVRDKIRRAKVK